MELKYLQNVELCEHNGSAGFVRVDPENERN